MSRPGAPTSEWVIKYHTTKPRKQRPIVTAAQASNCIGVGTNRAGDALNRGSPFLVRHGRLLASGRPLRSDAQASTRWQRLTRPGGIRQLRSATYTTRLLREQLFHGQDPNAGRIHEI